LVAELFETIAFSASRKPTGVILEDAEGLFVSRAQSVASRDPTDVLRMTAALLAGLDRLRDARSVIIYATCNFAGVLDEAIVSRCDHVVRFELPILAERRAILAAAMKGFAGDRVLDKLAEATEGWSGRKLVGLPLQAFLHAHGRPEELTDTDFLAVVGLAPEPSTAGEEIPPEAAETATASIGKEEPVCPIESSNGYPPVITPRTSKLLRPWRWFATPQAS
jgi:AAA+ superfamily predicted ATPase